LRSAIWGADIVGSVAGTGFGATDAGAASCFIAAASSGLGFGIGAG
jgi:hypothetical protein